MCFVCSGSKPNLKCKDLLSVVNASMVSYKTERVTVSVETPYPNILQSTLDSKNRLGLPLNSKKE